MPDVNYPLEYWKEFSGPFPQMCFVDNAYGRFSLIVKKTTHDPYGHYMILIGKNQLASQGWYFQRQTLDHYEGAYIKFVDMDWKDAEREIMLTAINADLDKPWYKTLYDVPGVVGEYFGLDWFNLPGFDFCSERGRYLRLIRNDYDLKHPNPGELDQWTRTHGGRVTGRYNPGS